MDKLNLEDEDFVTVGKMDEQREMQEVQPVRRNSHVLTKPPPAHSEGTLRHTTSRRRSFDAIPDGKSTKRRDADAPMERPAKMTVEEIVDDYDALKHKYDELKREYKVAHRETREQSLELRDLKRQNASLTEAYCAIQKEAQNTPTKDGKLSKSEKSKYHEHFEMLEEQAAYFQHEYKKRDAHLSYLTKQTRDANQEKEAAEEEARRLQRKIRDLSASLTECRDDLLRLQPPPQASDSEVAEMYSDLVGQVSGWVDEKTEDPENLEEWFEQLKSSSGVPQDFRSDLTQRLHKVAKNSPECLPLLVQHLIHTKLQDEILSPRVYIYGLEGDNTMLLQGIEEGISELEPKRDALTLRRWRAETLLGLLKMEAFATEQHRHSTTLSERLAPSLSTILQTPITPTELHTRLIAPAVKLSNTIRISTTDYNHFSHAFSRSPNSAYAVHKGEIPHYTLLDNASSKIIKPDSNVSVKEDGRIGEEMFVVCKGLVRLPRRRESGNGEGGSGGGGRESPFVMVKPTLLVKLDEPMGRKTKIPRSLGGWAGGWFGGGGGGGGTSGEGNHGGKEGQERGDEDGERG